MSNKKEDKTRADLLWEFFDRSAESTGSVPDGLEDAAGWESLRSAKIALKQGPPDRYWMSFMPRLRQRMDYRTHLIYRWMSRARLAATVSAFAVVLGLLSHEIFITSPRIDYLVEQTEWLRNLNPVEDATLAGKSVERSLLEAMDEQFFQGSISVEDVNLSIGFSELGYDASSLSSEEQTRILQTLEQNTTF